MTTFVPVRRLPRRMVVGPYRSPAAHPGARGHGPDLDRLRGEGSLALAAVERGSYAEEVIRELRCRHLANITLVSHSIGGYPATVAADREWERIGRLVHLDAAVPVDGQAIVGASPGASDPWVQAAGGDGWIVAPFQVKVLQVNAAGRQRSGIAWPTPITAFPQRVSLTGAVDGIARRDFVFATGWARRRRPTEPTLSGWPSSPAGPSRPSTPGTR
jgi:pimeloyl-ACP methyl ester carboxylesterase